MKKISIIIFLILLVFFTVLFTSCKTSETVIETEKLELKEEEQKEEKSLESAEEDKKEEIINNPDQENILAEFNKLFEENKKPYELIVFIDKNIDQVSEDIASLMIESLEEKQKVYKEIYTSAIVFDWSIQEKIYEVYDWDRDKCEVDKIQDDELKALISEIYDGGFKLIGLEGSFYPFIDYQYLKKYNQRLLQEFKDYFEIMAEESNNKFSADASITISWDDLAGRLIKTENYLKNYPGDTFRKKGVSDLYIIYLHAYIYGQDNTSSYDDQTKKVFNEVIDSYIKTKQNYPETHTGMIVRDHLTLLEDNDFKLTDELIKKINDFFKETIKEYHLDSPYLLEQEVKNTWFPTEWVPSSYIRLTNGEYREKYDNESATELVIRLTEFLSFGDLNGDDINDAVAILVANPGGSGIFYYLHAIENEYFYIPEVATEFLGDRVKIKSLSIESGEILLEMTIHSETDPICCPTLEVSYKYKLDDSQLKRIEG